MPSWKVTGSLLALALGGTAIAYVLHYALFAGVGAPRSIQITYLVPAIALAYGVLLLGEPFAGFEIRDRSLSPTRTYATYTCVRS